MSATLPEASHTLVNTKTLTDSPLLRFAKMIESVKNNTIGPVLKLSQWDINDGRAVTLAEALKSNHTVTHLDLDDNQIGNIGAVALAEAFMQNEHLISLSIQKNKIGNIGAIGLASLLRTNNTLKDISLRFNQIGDEGATGVARSLKTNNTLSSLAISSNEIGEVGLAKLTEALETNMRLTYLGFTGCGKEEIDAKIRKLISHNIALEKILAESKPYHMQAKKTFADDTASNLSTPVYKGIDLHRKIMEELRDLKKIGCHPAKIDQAITMASLFLCAAGITISPNSNQGTIGSLLLLSKSISVNPKTDDLALKNLTATAAVALK